MKEEGAMTIECTACGSSSVFNKEVEKLVSLYNITKKYKEFVDVCENCGEEGDFRGAGSSALETALRELRTELVQEIMDDFSSQKITAAFLERSLGLPQRTINRWQNGEPCEAGAVLLKLVQMFPNLLSIASSGQGGPYLPPIKDRRNIMGWSVTVTPPLGFPFVDERVFSFCDAPGNMYRAVKDMLGKQLRDMEKEECIKALVLVINELDKGDKGQFCDKWAVDSDKTWSDGRDSEKDYQGYQSFNFTSEQKERCKKHTPWMFDYIMCTGHTTRKRMREDSIRFLLYYLSGYKVEFS